MDKVTTCAEDFKIGTRYWLDTVKDVSGIYVGRGSRNQFCFNSIEGPNIYIFDDEPGLGKVIRFAGPHNFIEII